MSRPELESTLLTEDGCFGTDTLKLLAMLHINANGDDKNICAAATDVKNPISPAAMNRRSSTYSQYSKKRRSRYSSLSSSARKAICKRHSNPPSPNSPIDQGPIISPESNSSTHELLNPIVSPENIKKNAKSPSLPPLPPTLRRTYSEPISPENYNPAAAAGTNLQRSLSDPIPLENNQVAARTYSRSPSCDHQESPHTKRLKRMRERMQEMTEWCKQVTVEDGEAEGTEHSEEKEEKDEYEKECGEAVWVDQIEGGGLIIHFKCPCGEGYEILLSGNTCYYKLM